MTVTGIVFDIQRAALHDGPGLRTTVFLKGCQLRCAWCHNPESFMVEPQTGKSGKVYGKAMSVAEVMQTVLADLAYYESSGGGLTLSGGEPTMQFDFCHSLLSAAKAEGVHTCLDTCGFMPPAKLNKLIPLVDLFHFDLKLVNSDQHKQWTGKDNLLIQTNLETLRKRGAKIRLRCPVIPGVNDTPQHEAALKSYESTGDFETVERLAYHTTGMSKYDDLGLMSSY